MTEPNAVTELARRLAGNEIAAWQTIYQAASADLATQLGIGYAEEHGALIAARLAEARRLGCDLACSQTLADHPAQHNMAQAGFKIAYEQQNFVPPRIRG